MPIAGFSPRQAGGLPDPGGADGGGRDRVLSLRQRRLADEGGPREVSEQTVRKQKSPRRSELLQNVQTVQKPGKAGKGSHNELAPQLQRCQFCFSLNTLVVVEEDVVVNKRASLLK